MGSDIIVALKEAAANNTTLFALNPPALPGDRHAVQVVPAQTHEAGQTIRCGDVVVPQVRQTNAVLGLQLNRQWGLLYCINETRLAIGVTSWQSRLPANASGLGGGELVRLALERSRNAHQ